VSTQGTEGSQILLVVCRANLIRSPIATGLLRTTLQKAGCSELVVRSAGLQVAPGSTPPEAAMRAAEDQGIDLISHRASGVTASAVSCAALVLTMTEAQRAAVARLSPMATPRVFTLAELVRLTTVPDAPEEQTWRELAHWAHVRRPLVAPASEPEDVPDPIGRSERYLRVVVNDLVDLCRQVAARVTPASTD